MNLRDVVDAVDECCLYLDSNKVTDRKRYCSKLSDCLENNKVIKLLNEDNLIHWKKIITSVQECLRKDASKIIEESKTKGCSNIKYPSADLFIQVITIATKEADDQIGLSNLVGYIIGCMKDNRMKKCYYVTFMHALCECILSNSKCRGRLDKDDWEGLFVFLKELSEYHRDDIWIYKCFLLMVRWGPSSGLAPMLLRQEYNFMMKLCQIATQQSPKLQQEHVVDIALHFCKNTAKDNKVSCCKFGEDMCCNFVNLYELNGREARIKELIVEFFLLQLTLHHPNGVYPDHPCSYAFNWNIWNKCLKMIYSVLAKEIQFYFKYHHKNSSFFLTNGDAVTISQDFLLLFIEVSRQLFVCLDVDMSVYFDCTLSSQGSQKRQKLDINLKNYINNIQETKSWLWINIVCKIIEIYPDLIEEEDYLTLLQILSNILIESNDHNVVNNIYVIFSVMLDMQYSTNTYNTHKEIDKLWKTIGETTTRAFGLNQHKGVTEVILKKLIERKIVDLDTVIQTYTSGILIISVQSISVLAAGLQIVNLNKTDITKKETLMNCILNISNLKDCKYLLDKKTARFLVDLTLKQWPWCDKGEEERIDQHKYSDIIDIHFKTLLKKEILLPIVDQESDFKRIYNIDFDVATMLTNILENFIKEAPDTMEILLSIAVLLINILNYLVDYNIIEASDVDNSPLINFLQTILNKDVIQKFDVFKNKHERESKKVIEYIDMLDLLFTMDIHESVMSKVKNLIPLQLLKKMSEISNELNDDSKYRSDWKFHLKKCIIKTLSSFCCVCGNNFNKNQKDVLEVLSKPDYKYELDEDYILLVTFLRMLKYTKPGIIPDAVLNDIRNSIQDVCASRYLYTENALEILEIMHDLYQHFSVASDDDDKGASVAFLKPFYDTLHNYGPEVSLALLKCIGQLIKLDPDFHFACWSNKEIIKFVPKFLCNDYQEVRLKAVEILVMFFQTSNYKKIQNFHRQEEVLVNIFDNSTAVFSVEGEFNEEHRVDETLGRTASVLHTFGSIIMNCNSWIEECLFAFIKLAYLKNIESVDKMLKIISNRLLKKPEANIIENYLEFILEKWINEGFSLDDFQFKLIDCEDKMQFYHKYFDVCAPFFLVSDKRNILDVAQQLGILEQGIVERIGAKVFTRVLCSDVENINLDIFKRNQLLEYFVRLIGLEDLKKILTKNLEHIILGILDFLTDERYIFEIFQETVIFSTKKLSTIQLKTCLNFIENLLCNNQKIVPYLSENGLYKLEKILLALKLNIFKVLTIDDKLKMLHRYTYFLSIFVDNMIVSSVWQFYFIRDTIYFLLNLIENYKNLSLFATPVCRFLFKYLKSILPTFSETFGYFLTVVVNSLKNFCSISKTIWQICIEIMQFLIIENSCHLMSAIEKLDSFPQHPDFDDIRNVHHRIKYGNSKASLEEEITYFLQHEDLSTRQDSLSYLKNILSKEKVQLKQLYENLREMRGFSEDCKESLLHKLVSTLAKMGCSANEKVSFEAIKCLGELGPADLRTLVLQPEKPVTDHKCNPFELLSGHIISLLTQYIVDPNIDVVNYASETLYIILNCKEGRKIGESNTDFGYGSLNKKSIIPFFSLSKSCPSSSATVDTKDFVCKVNVDELWCPDACVTHEVWLVSLVCDILETFTDHSYLRKLIPICKVKPKFCEYLLPLVINVLVCINNEVIMNVLSTNINRFFALHWENTVPKILRKDCITLNKKSVRCMLEVINFVRLQRSFSISKGRNVGELDINYLQVAKAAEFSTAHFSALFYAELWCQSKIEEIQNNTLNYCEQRMSMIDIIYEHEPQDVGQALQIILRNAYKALGDLDALSGCGISFLLEPQCRVEHYKEHGKWDQVILFYANQCLQNPNQVANNLMDSFKKSSLYQIPLFSSKILEEPQYECLWRLSQWNTGEKCRTSFSSTVTPKDFEKYRFYSLRSLHENDSCSFEDAIKLQNLCVIENLRHTSFESSKNLYPILAQLQSIVEMEDFFEHCLTMNFAPLINKWKLQDNLVKGNYFQYIEPVIAQRVVILNDYLKKYQSDELKTYLINLTLDVTAQAKDEGYFKEGLSFLENLKCITNLNSNIQTQIQLLDAQLSWLVDNKLVARHILNTVCKNNEINPKLKSIALKLSGQYMSETYSENRVVIISDYFLKSISIIKGEERDAEDNKSIIDTYDKLAQFADREYQQINTYMKSDLFQKKVVNMEKARKTASSIAKQRKKTQDENRAAHIHDRNSNIDESEIRTTRQESNRLLQIALKYYIFNLHYSDSNNIRIFRIMSLFLENRNNTSIAETVDSHINKIPSYKYITMLPQLIPHITETSNDLFSQKVNEIVEKCAKDHPHHTLPLLLSLANANKDREYSDQKTNTSQNDNRITTANTILGKLKKNKQSNDLIDKLQQLSIALIDLAYFKDTSTSNDRKTEFQIPKSQKITKIKNFENVLLPTVNLKVSPSNDYSNIVGISSFDNVYYPVGGINTPKRITCRGTDGNPYSQLVKGHDDLRQDAVMQQVFTIMNNLLSSNKETSNLYIRTYKIVPLSMRSGILEWVNQSMPIGQYLVGDKNPGAHQKYRPKDKLPAACRNAFKNCANQSQENKLKIYKSICHSFKPVLHKFFEEYFPQATMWYERRRAYIHSVATTSICGYVLGIGDRHVSNILIDTDTAEVIHIDFGIAFEQGRVLPTPETVPFRLTRDIVDGMGVSGVDGIFRKSCEKTMKVLRQNSQTIITILEVLLYDPLYAWTVTSAEANKRQTDDDNYYANMSNSSEEDNNVNVSAERALLRLREKLQGTELGHPTSIEHQVGTLIQQAVDPANLCKLFHGWQPYL